MNEEDLPTNFVCDDRRQDDDHDDDYHKDEDDHRHIPNQGDVDQKGELALGLRLQ